ncbi:aryl carrier-like protein [Nonomuraea thailandensis]|uniref:Aryl carrier-like protein n=1 Tax=Nonomuraea thailandensis TaxID=1188745 RepID=A0A9X2GF58_9ACTN|nr:phosphopantetheine-binding protein [Nonomuraea thailandensis]MCP2356562.1 aryl carrier-like protein [Nonomuraea thailandensis]
MGSELERSLSRIWVEELGLDAADPDGDFFAAGGTSLLAVRLAGRVRRELRLDMEIDTLVEHPTLGALTAFLARGDAGPAAPSGPA